MVLTYKFNADPDPINAAPGVSAYDQFVSAGASSPNLLQSKPVEEGSPSSVPEQPVTPVAGYKLPGGNFSTDTVNENERDLESGRGFNPSNVVINPLHEGAALPEMGDGVESEQGIDVPRKGSMAPTEDLFEEAVIAAMDALFPSPPAGNVSPDVQAQSPHVNHNKKNCQQKVYQYSAIVIFQLFYMAAALQAAANSGAAARKFLGKECLSSDPVCFFKPDAGLLFVASVVACAWYANYRTMLEYLPATLEKMWNMFAKGEFTRLRVLAFLLGLAGGIVAFELNMEAMAGFISSENVLLQLFGWFVVASGVGSTFSSRFMGSDIMLSIIYERLLSCLFVDSIYRYFGNQEKADFYKNRRQLLMVSSDIHTYEYLIPDVILSDFCDKISDYKAVLFLSENSSPPESIDTYRIVLKEDANNLVAYWCVGDEILNASFPKDNVQQIMSLLPLPSCVSEDPKLIQEITSKYSIVRQDYEEAFSLLYSADPGRQWSGLLPAIKPSYLGRVSYGVCLGVLAFVCLASYPISYNITKAAFPVIPSWNDISYVAAFPNTLFYVYSLLFVVDQVARSFTLSQGFSGRAATARWLGFNTALLVAVLSCLNLVYTASSQADKGDYNNLAATMFDIPVVYIKGILMVVAALISGLCNLLPILKIDEKYANKKHYQRSQGMFADINQFICGNSVSGQANVAHTVSQQHEAYKAPFFPAFFTGQTAKEGVYAPLLDIPGAGAVD